MNYLVTFYRDWADELDVYGFRVLSAKDTENLKSWFAEPRTIYFGTNEGWDDEVLLDSFTFTELNDDDAATLNRIFPHGGGFIPYIDTDTSDDEE